jgi:hypothetical protein
MTISHPLRSVIVDFLPDDEAIAMRFVELEKVRAISAKALTFPMFFDEEAARVSGSFALDDEFARRLGAAILKALGASYPDLQALLTITNSPIAREITPPPD